MCVFLYDRVLLLCGQWYAFGIVCVCVCVCVCVFGGKCILILLELLSFICGVSLPMFYT